MKLLISACLLGEPCRYDGKSRPLPAETLARLRSQFELVPVCPETLGGLPTPRVPSELQGERVVTADGRDVTADYTRGAQAALAIAREHGAFAALLKERSPSCGKGEIYDGSFTRTLKTGNGVTAEVLLAAGFAVHGESEIDALCKLGVRSEE